MHIKPSYTPDPTADTRTLLIYRDECGYLRANDVELGRDLSFRAGAVALSDKQVEMIRDVYEARGYTIVLGQGSQRP